ncbi:MAG: PEP/pyruvate-binding domain-containing protein [Candidatus Dojkabacteria bacterium]|nr:MAG: PEP/pyruvate-binding domain-containing protein [Candidatus Dojkabacteria bacterium]
MFGFAKKSEDTQDQSIFFHEDYAFKDVNEALVGRKGRSLFQLRSMDIPTPGFFVISPEVYKKFLLKAFDHKLENVIKNAKEPDISKLEKLILEAEFDRDFYEELLRAYSRLSGFSNAWVAVRSSVVYPKDPGVSFSGVFATELNVRNINALVESVKHVYLSLFRDSVVAYAANHSVDLTEVQMAVVVQKMIQPEVSGVAYTVDPITNDSKKVSIEAVFGLGDVIADGTITPDQYLLNKKNLEILEKHISPQDWMKIRNLSQDRKPGQKVDHHRIQISQAWSHQQKLEDKNVEFVAKVALIAEDRVGSPQIIEWLWESGTVWVLQSKPIIEPAPKSEEKEAKAQMQAASATEVPAEPVIKDPLETSDSTQAPKTEEKAPDTVFDVAVDIVKEEKLKEKAIIGTVVASKMAEEAAEDRKLAKKDVEEAKKKAVGAKVDDLYTVEETRLDRETAELKEEVEQMPKKEAVEEYKEREKDVKTLEKLSEKFRQMSERAAQKNEKAKEKVEKKQVGKLLDLGVKSVKDNMEFLLTGIGASAGAVTGEVKVIGDKVPDKLIVTKGTILLLKKFSPDMEKYISEAGGVLMDEGGLTSDVAILCRELEVPAVVGTGLATTLITEGEVVKIDGTVGSVYRVLREKPEDQLQNAIAQTGAVDNAQSTPSKPDQVVKMATATKVMLTPEYGARVEKYNDLKDVTDGYGLLDLDMVMVEKGRHPLAYAEEKKYREYSKDIEVMIDEFSDVAKGNEVIVSLGSGTVGMFRELVKGTSMEGKDLPDEMNGVARYMQNTRLFEKVMLTLKRVRNVYKSRNVSIALHSPVNGSLLKDIKKEMSAAGLRRTTTLMIYAVIDRPSEVILVDDILAAGVDGVIINTPWLARQMQGFSVHEKNVRYDLSVGSVAKILESILAQTRGSKQRVYIIAEDDPALIKKAVEWGVYGVMVKPEAYMEAKRVVAETEARMVMKM